MLTRLERIHRTAVRALCLASAGYVQVHLGVAAENLHLRFGARAVDAALGVEVRSQQLDVRCAGHAQTLASQDAYFGLRPLTISKNAA